MCFINNVRKVLEIFTTEPTSVDVRGLLDSSLANFQYFVLESCLFHLFGHRLVYRRSMQTEKSFLIDK